MPDTPDTPARGSSVDAVTESSADVRACVQTEPAAALTRASELRRVAHLVGDTALEADAAHTQALAALALHEADQAEAYAAQAARLCATAGLLGPMCGALLTRARAALAAGDADAAARACQDIESHESSTGPTQTLADALLLRATIHFRGGQYAAALEALQRSADLRVILGDDEGHAKCLNNIALVHEARQEYPQALSAFTRCLEYLRVKALPLDSLLSMCLVNIGLVYRELGDHANALRSLEQGIEAAQRTSTFVSLVAGHNELGLMRRELGQLDGAVEAFTHALHVARAHELRHEAAEVLDNLGQTYALLGRAEAARATFEEARRLATELDSKPCLMNVLLHVAALDHAEGNATAALRELRAALDLTRHTEGRQQALQVHEQLAQVYHALGHDGEAFEHLMHVLREQRALARDDTERRVRNVTEQLELERARSQAEMYRQMNELTLRAKEAAEAEVRDRTAELELAQLETVARLGVAAEYRDDRTGRHTYRVGNIAALLARALGLPDERVHLIRLAARLHDVGKIGVPDAVLLKTGRYTPEEYEIMRHHTTIGARVLQGGRSELIRLAEEIALTHHERWDGQGYPRGLSGTDIPLPGRIVAVADVWDALTTARPYKVAWTVEDAAAELRALSGSHFDPDIVAAMLALVADGILDEHLGDTDAEAFPPRAVDRLRVTGEDAAHASIPHEVRAYVDELVHDAWQARFQDPEVFTAKTRQARRVAEEHGYDRGAGYAMRNEAFARLHENAVPAALQLLHDALAAGERHDDLVLQRDCALLLSSAYARLHSTERSVEHCRAALTFSETMHDDVGRAKALANLGLLHKNLGQTDQAVKYLRDALAIHEQHGNTDGRLTCLYNLADVLLEAHASDEATTVAETAVTLAEKAGNFVVRVLATSVLARALEDRGATQRALALHEEAWQAIEPRKQNFAEIAAWTAVYAGGARLRSGADATGRDLLNEALRLAEQHDLKRVALEAHRVYTDHERAAGNTERLLAHVETMHQLQLDIHRHEHSQRTAAMLVEFELDRARAEAESYRTRTVELASANVALEKANREKTALLAALQEQSKLLERQLQEDALTGLYTRRRIEEQLQMEFRAHAAAGRPLAVVMVDVDHFKRINDDLSHMIGDDVLRRVSQLFLQHSRPTDWVGRYGGEEFLLVLPDTTLTQALGVAERIRRAVETHPWHELHPELRVTLSAGVCTRTDVSDHEKLLALADKQLYHAKHAGRNCVRA